jgi:hypothetical protein
MRMTRKSSTTAEEHDMARRKRPQVHPGVILLEEFLSPLGVSQYRLAKEMSVPGRRINEIGTGNRDAARYHRVPRPARQRRWSGLAK